MDDEMPKTQCPKCLAWLEDFDGFGVLAHLEPDGCGYCSHPSLDGNVCGICEATVFDTPAPIQPQPTTGPVPGGSGK